VHPIATIRPLGSFVGEVPIASFAATQKKQVPFHRFRRTSLCHPMPERASSTTSELDGAQRPAARVVHCWIHWGSDATCADMMAGAIKRPIWLALCPIDDHHSAGLEFVLTAGSERNHRGPRRNDTFFSPSLYLHMVSPSTLVTFGPHWHCHWCCRLAIPRTESFGYDAALANP